MQNNSIFHNSILMVWYISFFGSQNLGAYAAIPVWKSFWIRLKKTTELDKVALTLKDTNL